MNDKKLSDIEAEKSFEAVRTSLNEKLSYTGKADVTVDLGNNGFYTYKNVGIVINYNHIGYMTVDVAWKDDKNQDESHTDRGLHNYYSTTFTKMHNKGNFLFIEQEKPKPYTVIITYLDLER